MTAAVNQGGFVMLRRTGSPVIAAVLLAAGLVAGAPAAPAAEGSGVTAGQARRPHTYVLPGREVFPEGSAVQARTGTFWVSSTTDGTIYRGSVRERRARIWLRGGTHGRTMAVGLEQARGRLYVAGGDTGRVWVYDAATGRLLARLDTGVANTFINDVAVARDGAAYFTDSFNPYLYRVSRDYQHRWRLQRIDLTGTVIPFAPGFNLNGIAAGPHSRYLYVIHSSSGRLFRVDIRTHAVREVDLGGVTLTAGDGVERHRNVLYVVRNQLGLVAKVRLDVQHATGTVVRQVSHPSFRFPTTAEVLSGRLLVVNSQFDKRAAGQPPELPFTVSSISLP